MLIRWSISQTFAARGHTVMEAADGQSARQTVAGQRERPDAIVLDYRLPDSDDLTLLEDLTRSNPGRPIILMTAYATQEVIESAVKLGAAAVLTKPFDLSDLEHIVASACRPTVQ